MSLLLAEKGGRYNVEVEALSAEGGATYVRYRTKTGRPVGWPADVRYQVQVGDAAFLELGLGENGLTVGKVKLLNAREAVLTAVVTPGLRAPDWLPERSEYLLFTGDASRDVDQPDRYIPLDGMASETPEPSGETASLDRLAIAIGRSIARANAVLAQSQADAGVGLVSEVTLRVAVNQIELAKGRVVVTLAPPGTSGESQFIEFTMSTVPGASGEGGPSESDKLSTVGTSTVGQQTGGQSGASGASGPSGGQAGGGQNGTSLSLAPQPRTSVQTPAGVFRTRGSPGSGGRRPG